MFLHSHLRLPHGNNLVVSPMPHQGSFMRPQRNGKKWLSQEHSMEAKSLASCCQSQTTLAG